ncbi:MAG: hypothetical protein A2527_10565 [Candidatus Lambdaproteobacteria bacterium RIFOXYD2_FULL_50_16]|uniref:4Fe-4S ferredoxin-type domain-containing protein n=1 Tax=Candidatus Lambdaproteobacteria bacterium RIFOXYD2_FULL_50_16 TaxID=1817772 RepID=A0A1F6GGP3_9PROT|nr:MAG: hypothetical protein A2527_10565 [Candidatus Lambdaproteobacteria bacterium RIFOXYD2_FULL_50_16]
MSFKAYFGQIVSGVQTMFEGMSISLASTFLKVQTVEYPDVDISSRESLRQSTYKGNMAGMPENYRGILKVDLDICTACLICMKACPIDCIAITNVKCDKRKFNGKSGKAAVQTRAATRFDIDIGKCMFCGLCVIPCPTGAIAHSKIFEMNRGSLAELVERFVTPEQAAKHEARALEIETEEAEKKAAKAKTDAEAKAKVEPKGEA